MDVQLFNAQNINELEWPQTEDGRYAQRFLTPFILNGVDTYVDNIRGQSLALRAGDLIFPVFVTDSSQKNSWVCSPTTQFVDYGLEHINLVGNPLLANAIKGLLALLGKGARKSHLDRVVYVNNWLFAVDLYPGGLSPAHIASIREKLRLLYPEHAIVFRSINPLINQSLLKDFEQAGFRMLCSRYIHITDASDPAIFQTRILKSDLKLLRESTFEVVDHTAVSSECYKQFLMLYNSLYIKHHSAKNPQINSKYMQSLVENRLLEFKVVMQKGRVRGVAGYMVRNGVFLCPFFGFEKDDADQKVIYRLLSTALLLEARERGALFHQSAGATFYKTIRRAKGCYEYNAIYTKHLPLKQRIGWMTLKAFINSVAPPFMKKY